MPDLGVEQPTEQLRLGSARLQALARVLGRVAHEINNPLAGIKTASELLRRLGPGDADQQRYAGIIDHEAGHIAGVVRYLTDTLEVRGSPSCTARVADAAAEARLALADPDGGVQLLVRLDEEARDIEAPEPILRLVMYSMLRCAVAESPPGSTIELRGEREDRAVVLTVRTLPGTHPMPVAVGAVDAPDSETAKVAEARGLPAFDISFAADMLELFDGSLTISGAAGDPRCFVCRWPAVPMALEAERHGG